MYELTGNNPFVWTETQDKAFEGLKKALAAAPMLALLADEGQFRVEVDASGVALGGVLSQKKPEDKTWKPVAFISRTMNDAEL